MALREVLAKFGIDVDDSKLKAADKGVDGLAGKLKELVTVFATGALVKGLKDMASETVAMGARVNDVADKLGIGTTELQEFQYAAKMSGVETETANSALTKFTKNIGEARTGSAGAKDAFKAVGLDEMATKAGSATDLLRGVAQGLQGIEDPTLRAKAAQELFGKAGADLIPLLKNGAEGIDGLVAEAHKLGGVLNEETIQALAAADDESDRLDFTMRGLKAQITLALLPALQWAGQKAIDFAATLSQGGDASDHFKVALATLGAVGLAAGLKMAAPYLGMAVLLAALVLIVDDLATGLRGGDSVTGRILDRIFGKGAGASIFKSISDDAKALWKDLGQIEGIGPKIEEVFSRVGARIVGFFVDDIPAALGVAAQRAQDGTATIGEHIAVALAESLTNLAETMTLGAGMAAGRFIDGIVEGIKKGAIKVAAAVKEMATGAVDQLTSSWQIFSPSHVAEDRAMFFGLGAAKGVDKSTPAVEASARSMANATVRAFNPGPTSVSRSLVQHNTVSLQVQGTGPGAVQHGVSSGLGEAGRAGLAMLETVAL